jgi:signal transduction histidine kinase/CheY-like chemotaxis protein
MTNTHARSSPDKSIDDPLADQAIRDLMGLLALPALWAGRDGETILQIMIEAAERIVPLRFAYAQAALLPEQPQYGLLRTDGAYVNGMELAAWGAATAAWSDARHGPEGRVFTATTPLGEMRIIRLSMGYGSYGGKIWFGSTDPAFPTANQAAFLRAAASLAATGLQAARASYEREQASRAKDEFLAMLGHELRNPLAPILTALELFKLRNNGLLSREHKIIERQAKHLSRLVDDLLDVTRITRGKVELRKEPANLREILARAIEDTGPLLEDRHHTLTIDFPDNDVHVFGDATRLVQIFSNLLTNAAKYTDPGGTIAVLTSVGDGRVSISIRDNGIGISPQVFPRLFKIFEQGAATIDRSKGGLGIGLALVKNFVELHGGSVTARSAGTGYGSEFTVTLPLLKHPANAITASPPVRKKSPEPLRVLLVDDNIDALESTNEYLRERGHAVRATSDPLDALKIAGEFRPEVALLDIGLPVMDGYTLASELRHRFPALELRLIALTGYGQAKDRERTRLAGFDVHLVKPVLLQDLDAALAGRAP